MAWAAFQVLANRCVEWEKEEGRGIAKYISTACFRIAQVPKKWCKCI